MATFTKTDSIAVANKRVKTGTLTLGTYATGGEVVNPSVFGLKKITALDICGGFTNSAGSSGYVGRYNHTTGKLVVQTGNGTSALAEVANATDLSSYSTHVVVWGY